MLKRSDLYLVLYDVKHYIDSFYSNAFQPSSEAFAIHIWQSPYSSP